MGKRQKQLLIISFFLGLFLLSWFIFKQKLGAQSLLALPDHSIIEFQIDGKLLNVEVVNTPASITQGLSGREKLETDGMLFVFAQPQILTFWMKDMKFPIDIIWLKNDLILGKERNVQPPAVDTPDEQLERFIAPQPANLVLETNPFLLTD